MRAASNTGQQAPILGTAYRSPARVAFDLWRARGSFRGFVEFAVIGAVVLWFLGAAGTPKFKDLFQGAKKVASGEIQTTAMQKAMTPFLNQAPTPLSPRLNEIRFDARDFAAAPEPLRGQLELAFKAYRERHYQNAIDVLNDADPANRLVLLMRGLSLIALRGGDTFQSGLSLLRQSADGGEAKAMAFLGLMTINGLPGLTRNVEEGRKLLEEAAKAGATDAFRLLGEGYVSGWTGSVDPARAVDYLRTASERGDTKATFRLGELYFAGRGMAQDHKEAERLFLLAANRGHIEAQAMVGVWRLIPYINGVTDDPSEALQWLERAAAEGEPHAMEYLGMFYVEIGKRTGMGDLPRGVELFRRCTEQTLHSDCVFAYATALDMGMGVPRDPLKAYALYSVVNGRDSSNGRTPSQKTLTRMDKLIKELSREEVERAHNMTFAMWSKHPTPAQKAARESERHAECNVASEQFCRQ